jgi:Secretion system C-terminal sorting domain
MKMESNFTSLKSCVLVTLCSIFFLLTGSTVFAQPCSSLIITNSSAISASCPSGGSITVTATGTGLTYQLISGPIGYATASNTTGIFETLNAGSYVVEVKDACGVKSTVNLVVTNTYPAFSVNTAGISNVCNTGLAGGTITATITGGKPPYQYDIVPINATPVYNTATSSTSYNKIVNTFGTYRVYAKDACGEVRTYDIILHATQPIPTYMWWEDLDLDRPCGETLDGLPTITWKLRLLDENGTIISFKNILGANYQIYKPAVANSIVNSQENCTTSLGSLLSSGTVSLVNIPTDDSLTYPITIPQEDVILVFTTACGQTFKYCFNFNGGNPITPDAEYSFIQQTCSGTWAGQIIDINNKYVSNMSAPYTFLLTKSNATTQTNSNGYFNSLMPADFPLTIKVTDACGRNVTKTFTLPVQGSSLSFVVEPEWSLTCTDTKHTASAQVRITGGDLPGMDDATNIVITGGTVTAVPKVSPFNNWIPGYVVSNLLPAYTYKIVITNLCGEKDSVEFTVPADHWGQNTLDWNLTATVNALCGQNKSTITANSGYTGYQIVNYYLLSSNTTIATNTTGIFENITPGNYKVKFVVPSNGWPCAGLEIKDSINVNVLSDGAAQTITRKTITTCETNGVSTNAGKAIIEVSGSAPFTYEIIKTSLIGTGAEVWTVSSTNNPSNTFTWDIPLAGDPSNTVYTLRTTDKCGNKITTQASLQPINPPAIIAQNNPCLGNTNYTISIAPYGGDFTYRWVKLPDVVTTLSTQNFITFPGTYTAVNDGTYRCYVALAGCVERYKDVQISSINCNVPLPVKLISFTANYANQMALLQWNVENEINIKRYEIERSQNGADFVKIESVLVKTNAATVNNYAVINSLVNYKDLAVYYRLKIIEKDGTYTYSSILRLNVNESRVNIVVYPNPTKADIAVSFTSKTSTDALIKIIDKLGKIVMNEKIQVVKGNNTVKLTAVNNLPSGSYLVQVQMRGSMEVAKFLKL